MGRLGSQELIIILVILIVLFGGAKLPQLARNIGQAQKEFRSGFSEGSKEDEPEEDKNEKGSEKNDS